MRILVSGSRGLIGSSLTAFLTAEGHQVIRLVREKSSKQENAVYWNPQIGEANKEDFEGFDAMVHLAGENIFRFRWSKKKKETLFQSRCRDTWLLSQILTRLNLPPKIVISASAIGIYGDRGKETLTESSPPGRGFLADLCTKWEEATASIEARGSRVVHTRFGMVLSPEGGALKKMLGLFRWGLGGRIGSGDQFVSWIAIDDAIGAIYHCLISHELEGPVNVVAPHPVTNAQFTHTLAKLLHRPACFHIPRWVLRLILGEIADEVILPSAQVVPQKLIETGYQFKFSELEPCLRSFL
ncbi:MAG TPA: TIGR01777 family oxidoreductase [Chlamydiales bacterium]|nr:TIGR01777 family oxidoreductase [Chlamydiales bacterium]